MIVCLPRPIDISCIKKNFAYQCSEQHFVYCLNLQMYQPSPPVEKIFFYPRVASAEVANDTDDS